MALDIDHLKRRFASMSDEALLETDPGEFVDIARECFEAELAGRGLSRGAKAEGAAGAAAPGVKVDQPVLLASFFDGHEANFARALLEAAEIPCAFDDDRSAALSLGELRLLVPAALLERAREVLEAEISEEELAALAEAEALPEDDSEEPPPD